MRKPFSAKHFREARSDRAHLGEVLPPDVRAALKLYLRARSSNSTHSAMVTAS